MTYTRRVQWVSLFAAATLAMSAAACGKCGERAEPAASQPRAERANTGAPSTSEPAPDRSRPALSRRQARHIAPIDVAEAVAVLSMPEGARAMTGPSKPTQAERVQASYCLEQTTPAEAATAIVGALAAGGWTIVHHRERPEQGDRAAIAAERPPYRLSASVRRVPAPRCSGDAGHVFATVTVHKIGGVRAVKQAREETTTKPGR